MYFLYIGLLLFVGYTKNVTAVKKVLIKSEMRAGSSLTGELFNLNNRVFYLYEPLHAVWASYVKDDQLCFLDGRCRRYHGKDQTLIYRNTVHSIFNCRFDRVDTSTLSDDFLWRSLSTGRYQECMGHHHNNISKCVSVLSSICLQSEAVVIKTVRLTMMDVRYLMYKLPDVHLIHLVRDPRGILASRHSLGLIDINTLTVAEEASRLCDRILRDITEEAKLGTEFPNRIIRVRYEDLVSDKSISTDIYTFLNIEISTTLSRKITTRVHSKRESPNPFSTQRKDSSYVALKWRRKLNWETVMVIDQVCYHVYNELNYDIVRSEHILQDLTVHLYR